ncbi:MAG: c-type cytochrome [Deltaproteobacteria bacterium]|nr:c-type cytochrome [Deltaproteobacteria bacterium]
MKEAANIFDTRCMPCHGAKGAGDGPASKGLTPPPRNFQDSEWQKSVTDEHIEKIIKYGGAAVGKSPHDAGQPGSVGQGRSRQGASRPHSRAEQFINPLQSEVGGPPCIERTFQTPWHWPSS